MPRKRRGSKGSKRSSRRKGEKKEKDGKFPTESNNFKAPETVSFPKSLIGFPDRLRMFMCYMNIFHWTTDNGTSAPGIYNFQAQASTGRIQLMLNTLTRPFMFPNGTSGGIFMNAAPLSWTTPTDHNVNWYSIMSLIYTSFFVKRFRLEVDFMNESGGAPCICVAGYTGAKLYPAVSSITTQQLAEGKFVKMKETTGYTGNRATITIKLPWMTTDKLTGKVLAETDDKSLGFITGTPADAYPSNGAYGFAGWSTVENQGTDGTKDVKTTLHVRVRVFYEVEWKGLLVDSNPSLAEQITPSLKAKYFRTSQRDKLGKLPEEESSDESDKEEEEKVSLSEFVALKAQLAEMKKEVEKKKAASLLSKLSPSQQKD